MAEILHDRRVVSVAGPDAAGLLQGLITADVNEVGPRRARSAALLSPQGKVLFDFLIVAHGAAGGFALDCHRQVADELAERLGFYRLRARVDIAVTPARVLWQLDAAPAGAVPDPRRRGLGYRALIANPEKHGEAGSTAASIRATNTYHQRRIALGIAEGVHDFVSGSVFPHEANLDLLGGVSFSKGCYIGQEVVSRTHHRGSVRKRFLPCRAAGPLPVMGVDIVADGRTVGATGSCAASDTGDRVMALLRLDAVTAARQGTAKLSAGACALVPEIPDWVPVIDGLKTGQTRQ